MDRRTHQSCGIITHQYQDLLVFTLFKLIFGDEDVTPEEIKLGSARVAASVQEQDNKTVSKDTIEESRLEAIEHIRKDQAEIIRWRDRKVKLKSMSPGHLVL
jgi:hypothetical protein